MARTFGYDDPEGDFMTSVYLRRTYIGIYVCLTIVTGLSILFTASIAAADETECLQCHDHPAEGLWSEKLSNSVHADLDCVMCHSGTDVYPHETKPEQANDVACRECHYKVAEEYTRHGLVVPGDTTDAPLCADCHGNHAIVPTDDPSSLVHPVNQHRSCNTCHGSQAFAEEHYLIKSRLEAYFKSVHGPGAADDSIPAASCIDCHTKGDNPHRVYGRRSDESPINYFNIPQMCGNCHRDVEKEYNKGIHGQLVERGETDSPVCTSCHDEHNITATGDPRAPVSPTELAGRTCAPCHESILLNNRYGIKSGVVASFEDSYHGLKSAAGDTEVANCASCHGVHTILPQTDQESRVHPDNLQKTCGECHGGISAEMAQIPIHSSGGSRYHTDLALVIENIYIIAIIIIIGLMVLHWLIDLGRHLVDRMKNRPRIRRMTTGEVWQHLLLTISFIVLVITGFALLYDDTWLATWLFGWEGGFAMRGIIHRAASVVFMTVIVWHVAFTIFSRRGRTFVIDILPKWDDFSFFFHQIAYNLRLRKKPPAAGRFTYIEKAEYWALVWGSAVMVVSGMVLWFDDYFIQVLPQGWIEIAWVVHFWEAWLATLAIAVWHLYSTIFKPTVYPMNPAWLTGYMPEDLFKDEHPLEWDQLQQPKDEKEERPEAKDGVLQQDHHEEPTNPKRKDTGAENEANDRKENSLNKNDHKQRDTIDSSDEGNDVGP